MTDIPNQTVIRRIKDVMQCYGKLDYAEIAGKMAADSRKGIYNIVSNLGAEPGQLLQRKFSEVRGNTDAIEIRLLLLHEFRRLAVIRTAPQREVVSVIF